MKTFIFCLILSAVLYSCSNNVTGPTNQTSNVVFTRDSLVIYSDSTSQNTEAQYSVSNGVSGTHKFKITYTSETNVSDTNSSIDMSVSSFLPPAYSNQIIHYYFHRTGNAMNMNYNNTVTVSRNENNYGFIIFIAGNFHAFITGKYIKFRNIKITED